MPKSLVRNDNSVWHPIISAMLIMTILNLCCLRANAQEQKELVTPESILTPKNISAKYPQLDGMEKDSDTTDDLRPWANSRTDIFLLIPGDATPKQLTNDLLLESRPSWMGNRLLYGAVNDRPYPPESHIFLLDPTTGQREELLADQWMDYAPWYSSGADRFLFYSNRKGELALFSAAPDGSDIRELDLPIETGERETYAHVWSEDGSKIAYMQQIGSDRGHDTQYAVYYFDVSSKTIKRVSQHPATWGIFSPKIRTSALYPYWSGDSTKLIYTSITRIGEETTVEIVDYDTISEDYNRTTLMLSQRFELISAIMAIPSGQLSSKANYIVSILNIQGGAAEWLYFVEPSGELSTMPIIYREDTAHDARSQLGPSIGPEDQIAYVSGEDTSKFKPVSQYRKYKALFQ